MTKRINFYRVSIFLFSFILIAGCSSTRSTSTSQKNPSLKVADNGYQMVPADQSNQSNITVNPNKDKPSNGTLTDLIRRLPGVSIVDKGPYSKITIRGMASSFVSNTDPLFVVNGQAVGTNYSTVFGLVNPNDVVSMSVLKGSDATIYGSRGGNGVILIRTK